MYSQCPARERPPTPSSTSPSTFILYWKFLLDFILLLAHVCKSPGSACKRVLCVMSECPRRHLCPAATTSTAHALGHADAVQRLVCRKARTQSKTCHVPCTIQYLSMWEALWAAIYPYRWQGCPPPLTQPFTTTIYRPSLLFSSRTSPLFLPIFLPFPI